jgi:hypothetical protein
MSESGDTDPTTPKEMQQNEPNPAGAGGNRDDEAGERALAGDRGHGREREDDTEEIREFVEEIESDPARAGSHSPGEDLLGG